MSPLLKYKDPGDGQWKPVPVGGASTAPMNLIAVTFGIMVLPAGVSRLTGGAATDRVGNAPQYNPANGLFTFQETGWYTAYAAVYATGGYSTACTMRDVSSTPKDQLIGSFAAVGPSGESISVMSGLVRCTVAGMTTDLVTYAEGSLTVSVSYLHINKLGGLS